MSGILFWLSLLFIFYSYFGYPISLYLMTRTGKKPTFYSDYTPSVTLLIPAYNEEKVIGEKLENSLKLDYPSEKLQILVVTDGSDDRTPEIVKSFGHRGVELSHVPARAGKMAAINRSLPNVRGEIIVMSDANNFFNPETIKKLAAPFQDPTIGATGGAKYIIEGDGVLGDVENFYWKYETWVKKQETLLGCATGAVGEANAIRADLFISPPADTINDDFVLIMQVMRQGYRVVFVPEAKSYERVSASAADEVERRTRINAGRFQAISRSADLLPFNKPQWVWQVISHKYCRPLVPFFMILAMLASFLSLIFPTDRTPGFLWLSPPWNWILFGLQLLFYLLAATGYFLSEKNERNKLIKTLIYLPKYLVDSNFAALKGFWRFAAGRQTTQWKRVHRR